MQSAWNFIDLKEIKNKWKQNCANKLNPAEYDPLDAYLRQKPSRKNIWRVRTETCLRVGMGLCLQVLEGRNSSCDKYWRCPVLGTSLNWNDAGLWGENLLHWRKSDSCDRKLQKHESKRRIATYEHSSYHVYAQWRCLNGLKSVPGNYR